MSKNDRVSDSRCAVCGHGGYWVGYSAAHGEARCANHLGPDGPLTIPDDHSGIIAGFNATIRFLKYLLWPALFVAVALILLTSRSAS